MPKRQAITLAIISFLAIIQSACNDETSLASTPQPENGLLLKGAYKSDCYYSPQLSKFVIENIEYDEDTYTNTINQYSAVDCSSSIDGVLNTWGEITYYDDVITTDGAMAQRASFDIDTGGVAVGLEGVVELVYRKTEMELYFGAFTEGETPTVYYGLTYHKQ
ncbi:MAG TPA: hypothetical protein VIN71_12835 [Pseudomonadales bacterium]